MEGRIQHMSNLHIYHTDRPRMTSIICTIGPKTNSPEMMIDLRKAGMNIMRMNFSHGTYEYHGSVIENLKKSFELEQGPPVAIALDTKGPEIRTGLIKEEIGEVQLNKGQVFTLTTNKQKEKDGDQETVYVDYLNLPRIVQVGGLIYVDDGLISMEVVEKGDDFVKVKVLNDAKLGSRKGVNLPNVPVDLPAVSEKDKSDLEWGVEKGVDIVFASFIRRASDVKEIREILTSKGGNNIKIISKIENNQGIENFDEILKETDGVMVARGDLGIEIPPEKVFLAQKMMIAKCNIAGKPIICATQMLESMTINPRPTRAEVSDVANAVLDGADCVMLSGETAKGAYPVQSVEMMNRICKEAESSVYYSALFNELRALTPKPIDTTESIASSAVNAAFEQGSSAIIVLTTTGNSARLLSKYRPNVPIIVVTRSAQTARQVHLYRSCFPIYFESKRIENWQEDVDTRMKVAMKRGKELGFLKSGNSVIAIQGWKSGTGFTNTMRSLVVP